MSGECSTSACETPRSAEPCGSETRGGCPCGTSGCSGDPVDCAAGMWTCSFFQAMKDVQVDLLKAKIQKAWGAKMDKAADAVLEAMGVQWQSMLAKAQAQAEVRERLRSLWTEGSK